MLMPSQPDRHNEDDIAMADRQDGYRLKRSPSAMQNCSGAFIMQLDTTELANRRGKEA
jgi:hypothetical protein